MPRSFFSCLLPAFLALVILCGPAAAERRVALVVGNGAYEHVPKLRNPRNDAIDLTTRLAALGFEVIGGSDLDRRTLVERLIQFGRAAETADVALFYYAGHGLQVNGRNYLVPTDAQVEYASEIDISLVSLDGVMQQLERGSRVNLVFLDACRDNPFKDQLARSSSNRAAVPISQGLGRVQTGSGTFIAFATQPDAVASDGTGRNSPFTSALLTHIGHPGQSISDLMIEVRKDVMAATAGRQVPWDSSSLTGRFAFAPGAEEAARSEPSVAPADPAALQRTYELAVESGSCSVLQAFVDRFPDSFYADLARERIARDCAAQTAMRSGPEPATPPTARFGRNCSEGPGGIRYCATSVLAPIGKNRYETAMLFDRRGETAWVEGEEGDGVGSEVMLDFGSLRLVAGLDVSNGYDKDERTWTNNGRVDGYEIATHDGRTMSGALPDRRGMSRIRFAEPLETSSLTLTIRSVHRGAKYRDTAISELHPVFAD
jgi:uncharacterized caspase-like protein